MTNDNYVFFCDSNCELWFSVVDELGINVISMPYTLDGKEYFYDLGRKTDLKHFYDRVRAGATPVTSALNPQNYIDHFEPVLAAGKDILYVTFSQAMSGTFEFMEQAVKELKAKYPQRRITAVDTKNISGGAALLVCAAARLYGEGKSAEEVAAFVEKTRALTRARFVVNDLFHLKRGGRISGFSAVFGSIFQIKPILHCNKHGRIEVFAKAKGRRTAIERLFRSEADAGIDLSYPVGIFNADASAEDCEMLAELLRREYKHEITLWRYPIGPVVGTHCGPDTLGLAFISKK